MLTAMHQQFQLAIHKIINIPPDIVELQRNAPNRVTYEVMVRSERADCRPDVGVQFTVAHTAADYSHGSFEVSFENVRLVAPQGLSLMPPFALLTRSQRWLFECTATFLTGTVCVAQRDTVTNQVWELRPEMTFFISLAANQMVFPLVIRTLLGDVCLTVSRTCQFRWDSSWGTTPSRRVRSSSLMPRWDALQMSRTTGVVVHEALAVNGGARQHEEHAHHSRAMTSPRPRVSRQVKKLRKSESKNRNLISKEECQARTKVLVAAVGAGLIVPNERTDTLSPCLHSVKPLDGQFQGIFEIAYNDLNMEGCDLHPGRTRGVVIVVRGWNRALHTSVLGALVHTITKKSPDLVRQRPRGAVVLCLAERSNLTTVTKPVRDAFATPIVEQMHRRVWVGPTHAAFIRSADHEQLLVQYRDACLARTPFTGPRELLELQVKNGNFDVVPSPLFDVL